jgi:hypothetical protein
VNEAGNLSSFPVKLKKSAFIQDLDSAALSGSNRADLGETPTEILPIGI